MKETSASKLWKELEKKFLTKSCHNQLYLKKKLFRFQYQLGITMYNHISNFNKLVAKLLNLEQSIKDNDKTILLVTSLPSEYDHLITMILHGKGKITFDEVCAALYNNEIQKKDQKEHGSTSIGESYTARGHAQSRKPERCSRSCLKGRPAKDACAFCHEKKHWKKYCSKLKKM